MKITHDWADRPVRQAAIGQNSRSGFTLLEVLLVMLLVGLVLVALMMAIDFQFRVVEATRAHVEEAQLARVLLQRIAEDLRSVVPAAPAEASVQPAVAASSTESASDEEEDSEGQRDAPASGDQEEAGQDSEWTEDEESAALPTAGLCGGSDWIQIDVCRVPRVDQWERLVVAAEQGAAVGPRAGPRSVLYYLASENSLPVVDSLSGGQTGGLIREEFDGAFASLASAVEGEAGQEEAQPLAPEVTSLGFRYSDGTDWQESWDSSETGQLPVAVEITLTLRPFRQAGQPSSSWEALDAVMAGEDEGSLLYRLVVALPTSQAGSGGSEASGDASEFTQPEEAPAEEEEIPQSEENERPPAKAPSSKEEPEP